MGGQDGDEGILTPESGSRVQAQPPPPRIGSGAGRRGERRLALLAVGGLVVVGAVACGPEAERSRGGGPGADTGNRGSPVVLLEESYATRVFYDTPDDRPLVSGTAGPIPTLEPATPRPPAAAGATPVGATPGPAPFGSPTAVPDAATPVGATPVVPPATEGGTTDATPGIPPGGATAVAGATPEP